MSNKLRLVALVGVVALAVLALASLPALAYDEANKVTPKLNQFPSRGNGILVLDRNYENNHAMPQPVVPPDKDPKPGRTAGAPLNPANAADTTGGFGASVIGGGGPISSKSDRVERSLRVTADKLR